MHVIHKLTRKPTLWIMYFMNFLDRNAIVNGKIDKMDKDLGLTGVQYNTCVSIFFVGYVFRLSLAPQSDIL